jgi:hypothetical protein
MMVPSTNKHFEKFGKICILNSAAPVLHRYTGICIKIAETAAFMCTLLRSVEHQITNPFDLFSERMEMITKALAR